MSTGPPPPAGPPPDPARPPTGTPPPPTPRVGGPGASPPPAPVPAPAPTAPGSWSGNAPTPTTGSDREPILDLLRGFALLGILLVNIELMRGPALFDALAGILPEPATGADEVTSFLVGWLAAGKFISSFSILFGIGAGLLVARARSRGTSPQRLLARRYTLLAAFGLGHMLLLFPGDVLFAYAVTGFVLLLFVDVRPRTALWWSGGIVALLTLATTALVGLAAAMEDLLPDAEVEDPFSGAMGTFFDGRREATIAAYTDGSLGEILSARAFEALLVQSGTLVTVPWLLALFLLGYAATRAGVTTDLAGHRPLLRRLAAVGLLVGLPANLVLGMVGPVGAATGTTGELEVTWVELAATPVQMIGAPLLAVGYLASLTLLALRVGAWKPLAAVGRMALTAYLTQSLVTTVVFIGAGTYGAWSATSALIVVAGTWLLLLAACPLWLRWFRFGPAEWLWRSWTYRARQPLRR